MDQDKQQHRQNHEDQAGRDQLQQQQHRGAEKVRAEPVAAHGLPETKGPPPGLFYVVAEIVRVLGDRDRGEAASDLAEPFLVDLEGHIEVLDDQPRRVHVDMRQDAGPVEAGKAGHDMGRVEAPPGLADGVNAAAVPHEELAGERQRPVGRRPDAAGHGDHLRVVEQRQSGREIARLDAGVRVQEHDHGKALDQAEPRDGVLQRTVSSSPQRPTVPHRAKFMPKTRTAISHHGITGSAWGWRPPRRRMRGSDAAAARSRAPRCRTSRGTSRRGPVAALARTSRRNCAGPRARLRGCARRNRCTGTRATDWPCRTAQWPRAEPPAAPPAGW